MKLRRCLLVLFAAGFAGVAFAAATGSPQPRREASRSTHAWPAGCHGDSVRWIPPEVCAALRGHR